MEELFSLLKLQDHADAGVYDVAVVDCAPTGATLKLLAFADVFEWYMGRFFELERRLMKAIRPLAERVVGAPLPGDEVYEAVQRLHGRVMAVRALLSDPETTSIRLVCNPERMVLRETQRAFTMLGLFGYPVDMVVDNRMLPPEAKGTFLGKWAAVQKRHHAEVEATFAPLPVRRGPLFAEERVGLKRLAEMADAVFGEDDPGTVFYADRPIEVRREGAMTVLSIKMPVARKEEIDCWTKDGEVIVTVQGHRRNLLLPPSMRGMTLVSAKFQGGRFDVAFEKPR
jgi:arsenite-transporting ATPase